MCTRFADLPLIRATTKKNDGRRRQKKTMTVSKSGLARGFVVRRGNGGSSRCQRCKQQQLNTQSRVDWSWKNANLCGLDWGWRVAWSWSGR